MNKIDIKEFSLDSGKNNQIFHHYTNVNALINIVSNQTLHFTDCMFLNDKEEYNYIFKVIDKCFPNNKELKKALNLSIKDIDKGNNKTYIAHHKLKKGRYYVLSGCLKGDSLPMWNYYANSGNVDGYSIRFNIDGIIKAFYDFDVDIYKGKVIYDFKKQIDIIEKFVKDRYNETQKIIDELDKSDKDEYQREFENAWEDTYGDIFKFISFIRLFFKRSAWKYEEEYRIVVLAGTDDGMISKKFKSSKGLIKPYIEVKLDKLPIDEIKIGPNIEKEAARTGLQELIGNKKIKIKESNLLVR